MLYDLYMTIINTKLSSKDIQELQDKQDKLFIEIMKIDITTIKENKS